MAMANNPKKRTQFLIILTKQVGRRPHSGAKSICRWWIYEPLRHGGLGTKHANWVKSQRLARMWASGGR